LQSSKLTGSVDLSKLLPSTPLVSKRWLVQISFEMHAIWQKDFLDLGGLPAQFRQTKLAQDFLILEFEDNLSGLQIQKTIFPRWLCPIEHQWPVNPSKDGFVEKAAQGICRKFTGKWSSIDVFSTNVRLKSIAKGLKGRIHQLYSEASVHDPQAAGPMTAQGERILSVIVDEKGLFAGGSPSRIDLGTALTGGLGFLGNSESGPNNQQHNLSGTDSNSSPQAQAPSRAGGKIREVLDLLSESKLDCTSFKNWLELGASPGGMTQQLVHWGARVTAVDPADLAPEVSRLANVKHLKINAQDVKSAENFHALLSDMNGPWENAAEIVSRLSQTMPSGAIVVHTIKLNNSPNPRSVLNSVTELFDARGLKLILAKHLFHNRQELTLICQRKNREFG
jgi:23S rRNA U2552 (ribose-2'-O)-methylase RlmE/FtsJ